MKAIAIAMIALVGMLLDAAILGVGVWLTFFLGFSFWWWILIIVLSVSETMACYKFVNAVNGTILKLIGE